VLAHCGGSDSGNGLFPQGQEGGISDATMSDDGAPVPPDGPDTMQLHDGSNTDDGPNNVDATADATLGDDGRDASPDAPVADTGTDATLDGSTSDGGTSDGGTSDGSTSDGGPDASVPDGGPDGTAGDGGGDATIGDSGPLDASAEASSEAGTTATPCDAQAACNSDASTVMCCSGYCVDTARDPANCGQCGNGCTATQFCTGTACDDAIIANVCGNPAATVVLDPYGIDNEAGASIGNALQAVCVPATSVVQLPQDAGGVLDPSGRPNTGVGNTFITGGGAFGQVGVNYMELVANLSPLYLQNNGTTSRILTRAGVEVVNTLDSDLNAHHDYFYVQLAVEPQSGTLCFSGVGILAPGSAAAGYYAATELIPNRANYTKTWYVFEWQDVNGDSIPNAGDNFNPKGSGP
jgi:hypothetical protein